MEVLAVTNVANADMGTVHATHQMESVNTSVTRDIWAVLVIVNVYTEHMDGTVLTHVVVAVGMQAVTG